MKNNKFQRFISKLLKSKLFVASLAFYIIIPIAFLAIYKVDAKPRTAGNYYYYENGKLSSMIELTIDNKAKIHFYDEGPYAEDNDYKYKDHVTLWSYRYSDWKDNFDPEQYKHLSLEYIKLGSEKNESYFVLFKIGNELYSDFLIDESRGGGQKCYIKK